MSVDFIPLSKRGGTHHLVLSSMTTCVKLDGVAIVYTAPVGIGASGKDAMLSPTDANTALRPGAGERQWCHSLLSSRFLSVVNPVQKFNEPLAINPK